MSIGYFNGIDWLADAGGDDYIPVTGVSVTPATSTLFTNGTRTVQLTANVQPPDAENPAVTWSSSTVSVASVSSTGLVTAVANGTATITVRTVEGGFTATSTINVRTDVTSVTISQKTLQVSAGSTYQLSATYLPANATNVVIAWRSSNTAIATVSSTGLVTGVAAGTATITVTASSS